MQIFVIVILLIWPLAAYPPNKRSPQADEVIAAASAAPVELGVDILLRALETRYVADPDSEREILDRVRGLITVSRYPAPIVSVVPSARSTDSSLGVMWLGLNNRISRLSLTSRLIMLSNEAERIESRQLLLNAVALPSLTCKDGHAYRVDELYSALRHVMELGFLPPERERGLPSDYLTQFLTRIEDAGHVGPLIAYLSSAKLDVDDLRSALSHLVTILSRVQANSRSYSQALNVSTIQDLRALALMAHHKGLDPAPLIVSFGSFLKRSAKMRACADSDVNAQIKLVVSGINKLHRDLFGSNNNVVPDLQVSELQLEQASAGTEEADIDVFWRSGRARDIAQKIADVRLGDSTRRAALAKVIIPHDGMTPVVSMQERSEPGWRYKFEQLIKDVQKWASDQEVTNSPFTNFSQANLAYRELFEIAPTVQDRTAIAHICVKLLQESSLMHEEPAVWLLHALQLLDLQGATPEERKLLANNFIATGNPVMLAYAKLIARAAKN